MTARTLNTNTATKYLCLFHTPSIVSSATRAGSIICFLLEPLPARLVRQGDYYCTIPTLLTRYNRRDSGVPVGQCPPSLPSSQLVAPVLRLEPPHLPLQVVNPRVQQGLVAV